MICYDSATVILLVCLAVCLQLTVTPAMTTVEGGYSLRCFCDQHALSCPLLHLQPQLQRSSRVRLTAEYCSVLYFVPITSADWASCDHPLYPVEDRTVWGCARNVTVLMTHNHRWSQAAPGADYGSLVRTARKAAVQSLRAVPSACCETGQGAPDGP